MNNAKTLPAGLIDDRIEFFNDPDNHEISYCLTNSKVVRVNDAPTYIKEWIDEDISIHPVKVEALVELGYESSDGQREKYCSCCFGWFDGQADFVDGKFIHTEWWPCPKRGACPAEGRLCDSLKVGTENKALTKREIEVLKLVSKCFLNKEIAGELNISEETVKVHLKHIQEKSGLMNKKDLILLAFQKNLI